VVGANEILEIANDQVSNGTVKNIDLLSVQTAIDNLEKVFFINNIKEEVLSPVELVGPLLDAYKDTLTNCLANGTLTTYAMDNVFKV